MGLTKKQKTWLGILFVLYLAELIFVLFFSPRFGRTQGNLHGLNLVPLREIQRFYKGPESLVDGLFWLNIVGNLIAFLPMGFFVALLAPKKIVKGASDQSGQNPEAFGAKQAPPHEG